MESNERVEVILDLFREGHSAEEIADLLGYKGKGGVSGYMRRHGYRFDWTLKNYVKDPLIKCIESSSSSDILLANGNNMKQAKDVNIPAGSGNVLQGNRQAIANDNQQIETIQELQGTDKNLQESNGKVVELKIVTKEERNKEVLPMDLVQNLKEILQHKDQLLMMVTDQPKELYMKRYRGPSVTKTVQIQAQLSDRLTGFVNNTGYTVKDVMNKAVEDFLKMYGG
ncbi:hypothetical protein [Brevibacillus nitrificans]|uniref:hypothetical protein n=1 Tax=Brevibacillus nitrificans TaxID=651560 RepID=UPI00262EED56|nr:hypothetical protein [Brevibacillus nitrificans]